MEVNERQIEWAFFYRDLHVGRPRSKKHGYNYGGIQLIMVGWYTGGQLSVESVNTRGRPIVKAGGGECVIEG